MGRYAIYDSNGQIQTVISADADTAQMNVQTGQALLELTDGENDASHYVVSGALVTFPAQPSSYSTWDWTSLAWVDARTLADAQATQWTLVKAARDAVVAGGFTWNGLTFDSDDVSQQRIQGAVQLAAIAASAQQPFSIVWTLHNNQTATLSGTDMINVGLALGMFVQTQFSKGVALRTQIDAATSISAVEAIVWQ